MILIKKVIVRPWITHFIFSALLLYVLVLSGSIISGLLRTNVTALEVFINQGLNTPNTLIRIIPLSCMVCTLTTLNKLIKSNELTAAFSLGFSREQILYNILYVSLIISFFHFFLSGYIKPFSLKAKNKIIPNLDQKFSTLKKQGLITSKISNGKMWFKSDDYFFSYSTFNERSDTIANTTIYQYGDDFKLKNLYQTPSLTKTKDNKWTATKLLSITNIDNKENTTVNLINKSKLTVLKESPTDFKQIEQDITTLNFVQLARYVKKLNMAGISSVKYEIIILKTISNAIGCILFTLLGSIMLFSPNKRLFSLGKIIGICFSFILCYWLLEGSLIELAITTKISPYIAVFGIQALLSIMLLIYYQKNKTPS